ncbi:hypothetical protein ACEPAI_9515 [Sanghuangporus weigelae]
MVALKEYLREKAKFFSPETGIKNPNPSLTDVKVLELDALNERWKPTGIRYDNQMVDSLLAMLDEHLQDTPVEPQDYDFLFQPALNVNGRKRAWSENKDEYNARHMVYTGAVDALGWIIEDFTLLVRIDHDTRPPDDQFSSLVDFAIYRTDNEGKRALLEVKSPDVFDSLLTLLSRAMVNPVCPRLEPRRPTCEKVINKMCLYMASHKARWGAVTSHEKWVFIRLHPGEQPYMTFSSVELQENNTRPFRALLAMILAAELDLEDENVIFGGSGRVTREAEEPDLMIGWSQRTVAKPRQHAFYKVGYSDTFLSLGTGTIRLSLLRLLGSGSTGIVYQATLDSDQLAKNAELRLYSVKIVQKDTYHEKNGCIARLHHEFKVYSKIAQPSGKSLLPNISLYENIFGEKRGKHG